VTWLVNRPECFAAESLAGLAAAYGDFVRPVHGGVVRTNHANRREVALVIGGGSGHYPAFAGWVGRGLAHGAVCGNVFASPSASQIVSVVRQAHQGAGVVLGFGNYSGDVLNFGLAAELLRAGGIETRVLVTSDDIASTHEGDVLSRRGIAGNLVVFKIAGAAAQRGDSLDEVMRSALRAVETTVSLGVAFTGCTLPGAKGDLFTVPPGKMALGLGIHGEPGLEELPLMRADALSDMLVERLLEDLAARGWSAKGRRLAVVVNGLGGVGTDELLLLYGAVADRLARHAITVVAPEVGEHVTSLDMAGLSLTFTVLDDDLEELWNAPAHTPAFSRPTLRVLPATIPVAKKPTPAPVPLSTFASRRGAKALADALGVVHVTMRVNADRLGEIDAVAGDGDHGIGMLRGSEAAEVAAREAIQQDAGARTTLARAAEAWASASGGASGALWACGLAALGDVLTDDAPVTPDLIVGGLTAALAGVQRVGGAHLGDKTLLDAAMPFLNTLAGSAKTSSLAGAWAEASAAATAGADQTAAIPARRGRAKTHGPVSIGTPDAGAVSFALIVQALKDFIGTCQREETL